MSHFSKKVLGTNLGTRNYSNLILRVNLYTKIVVCYPVSHHDTSETVNIIRLISDQGMFNLLIMIVCIIRTTIYACVCASIILIFVYKMNILFL